MDTKLKFSDFKKRVLELLPENKQCDYDDGYHAGVVDTLADIESWLHPAGGEINPADQKVIVTSYRFVCEDRWIKFNAHFFANGEEYFIACSQNGDASLNFMEYPESFCQPIKRDVSRRILKHDCNGHVGRFYALLDIGYPLEFFNSSHSIYTRTYFDVRTESKIRQASEK